MSASSTSSPPQDGPPPTEEAVLADVRAALSEIEYGSIVITIHQGKVVGLETSTKRRISS
jgi:hypothetical protein